MKFENGCVVHRFWDGGYSELLATFQYESDAQIFCTAPRDKTGSESRLVVTSLFDGSQKHFAFNESECIGTKPEPPESGETALRGGV